MGTLKVLTMFLVVGAAMGDDGIVDKERPCPDGFFYAGEVSYRELDGPDTRSVFWEKGPTSPVYSCYRIVREQLDWVTANQRCWEKDGQMLSVNGLNEDKLLARKQFWKRFANEDEEDDMKVEKIPANVLTSGVDLGDRKWIWFATGEPINDTMMNSTPPVSTYPGADCLVLTWTTTNSTTILTTSTAPCVQTQAAAVCEVRVYVQTWILWFFNNWLQLLFLFTLILLIISSCLTLQAWTSRPARQPSPPKANNTSSIYHDNRYINKGKELLAKVVFYTPNKPQDKEKLTTEA